MGRSRSVVLSALAAATLAAGAPPAMAAAPPDFVGIVADDTFAESNEYREQTFAAQRAAGITLLRRTFDWSHIEYAPGQYDFSLYDRLVAAAARHGIRTLPVLFNPPPFRSARPVRKAKHGTYFPKRFADMGHFGAMLARRYGSNGHFWGDNPGLPKLPITAYQVWNEPNLPVYSPPRPNAKRYVKLLKATAKGIRGADPSAEILTAGLPDSRLSRPNLYKFIAAMYRAGAKKWFDTMAINPYARTTGQMLRKLRKVRRIMRRFGDRRARLWVTEIGWSDAGPRGTFRVGKRGQAKVIGKTIPALTRARSRLKLRGFVYYSWRDGRPYPPAFKDFWGLHTGLLRVNGSPKPALSAFKRAVARL